MAKQVKTIAQSANAVDNAYIPQQEQNKNLHVTVTTYDGKTGKEIGMRVVDMYHYGTRNWLQNHLWWAMHNGHEVAQATSTDVDIDNYLAEQANALKEKFQGTETAKAAA